MNILKKILIILWTSIEIVITWWLCILDTLLTWFKIW